MKVIVSGAEGTQTTLLLPLLCLSRYISSLITTGLLFFFLFFPFLLDSPSLVHEPPPSLYLCVSVRAASRGPLK